MEQPTGTGDQRQGHTTVTRPAWSPAQVIALLVGIAYVVLGGTALARTGIEFSDLSHTQVAGLDQTAIFALIEIAFGVILLGVGALPGADRGGMIFMGVIAVASGLIFAIEPETFYDSLGLRRDGGVFLVVTGAVLLIAAMVSPVISSRSDREITS